MYVYIILIFFQIFVFFLPDIRMYYFEPRCVKVVTLLGSLYIYMYVYMDVYICLYIYVYIYICACIHTYVHGHMHTGVCEIIRRQSLQSPTLKCPPPEVGYGVATTSRLL